MIDKQKGLYIILKTHLLTISISYITFFMTINFFTRSIHLLIAVLIAVIASVLYFIFTERIHKVYCYIIGVATGFLLSGYFVEYVIDFSLSFLIFIILITSILMTHLMMWRFKKYKTITLLYMATLLIVIIYAVSSFEVLIFRELLYMSIYLFILNIGVLIYVSKDNLNVERAINLSFFAAFMFLLFIVLLIITEGESGEIIGGFDGFEGIDINRKKKKTP